MDFYQGIESDYGMAKFTFMEWGFELRYSWEKREMR